MRPALSQASLGHSGKFKNCREVIREACQCVITTLDDDLVRTPKFLYRMTVIEYFIAGFDQQQVARRRDGFAFHRMPASEVIFGENVFIA